MSKTFLILIFIVTSATSLLGHLLSKDAGEFKAVVEELRADGIPTTMEELNELYPLSASTEKAIGAWSQAIEALDMLELRRDTEARGLDEAYGADAPHPTADWARLPRARQCLQKQNRALQLMREAVKTSEGVAVSIAFTETDDELVTNWNGCLAFVQLLVIDCQVAFRDADFKRVRKNLVGMIRVSEFLPIQNPTDVITKGALFSIAYGHVTLYTPLCGWGDASLGELQEQIASTSFLEDYRAQQVRSIATSLDEVRDWRVYEFLTLPKTRHLKYLRDSISTTATPWHSMLERHAALDEKTKKHRSWHPWYHWHPFTPTRYLFSKWIARLPAKRDCVVALLACERNRVQGNAAVTALSELPSTALPEGVSPNWLDPFDGQPLRYQRSEDELTVYSIGKDGKDDGGNVTLSDKGTIISDIGFRMKIGQ